MDAIEVIQVDERDSGWEEDRPRFRVYLHGSEAESTPGWTDTYDVVGADIAQTIDWAQRQAGSSLTFAIALVWDNEEAEGRNPGHGRGLVWLLGRDGNDVGPDVQPAQARMLARRDQPIGVEPSDQMPAGVPTFYSDGEHPTGTSSTT